MSMKSLLSTDKEFMDGDVSEKETFMASVHRNLGKEARGSIRNGGA